MAERGLREPAVFLRISPQPLDRVAIGPRPLVAIEQLAVDAILYRGIDSAYPSRQRRDAERLASQKTAPKNWRGMARSGNVRCRPVVEAARAAPALACRETVNGTNSGKDSLPGGAHPTTFRIVRISRRLNSLATATARSPPLRSQSIPRNSRFTSSVERAPISRSISASVRSQSMFAASGTILVRPGSAP